MSDRVLVLGGTGWVGRRVAAAWLDRGARVTVSGRGGRTAPEGAELVVLDRAEPDAYRTFAGTDWDEIVDVSSVPAHVAHAASALGDRAAHATYISSVSVYADASTPGADEDAGLVEPLGEDDPDDYARAKVAGEQAAVGLGARVAIVRPGLIVGPGDPTDRFGYWPARFAAAGAEPVLVPEAAELRAQVIDVDDLVSFVVASGARGFDGVVDAVGHSHPLADVLTVARETAGHTGEMHAAPTDWLERHGVAFWSGPRSLPLWLPADVPGFAARSGAAYRAAGGGIRPLSETVDRVLADERARGVARSRAAGLERAEELALIDALPPGR
ncbi:NAD-dependent epimerase/dehydratase family protein [Microbacterium sp. 77mftsu3.1]|uniref:NAD-dependent epimerase/dehydratase family protein n=1 Tax=Microbacterium sp. 77mftsu3.1 TaxID=1761802 RepID=UPI00036DBBC8|nr:NAD-dependent epimerase/dehydratase family protein [Microbacterium sp. 77mftsu3.1]SDG78590.1 Nucleoside-diphosphate-sugar epimerase [Microbacterium sp. 77mftsu3.1]